MKHILFGLTMLAALGLGACGDVSEGPDQSASTTAAPPVFTGSSAATPAANQATVTPTASVDSGAATVTTAPGSATAGATTPAAADAFVPADGINPPHGQPGHRCDIEVGKPLSSAPKAPGAPTNVTMGAPTPVAPSAPAAGAPAAGAPTAAAPSAAGAPASGRLNPPHGQPGHRCDIQVGQPLP